GGGARVRRGVGGAPGGRGRQGRLRGAGGVSAAPLSKPPAARKTPRGVDYKPVTPATPTPRPLHPATIPTPRVARAAPRVSPVSGPYLPGPVRVPLPALC